MKRIVVLGLFLFPLMLSAQVRFSIATDLSVMRNFSPRQNFFALGQTLQGNFHLDQKETIYAWLNYYSPGKFRNNITVSAKSAFTVPQTRTHRVTGRWFSREVSIGWKHYFRGAFDAESGFNFYSIAGFGLMFAEVENNFQPQIDTSLYDLKSPLPGSDAFKRLTLDVGLGMDLHLGGNVFMYSDLRTWIPTSGYPSPYLHDNRSVPLPLTLGAGLRILFGSLY